MRNPLQISGRHSIKSAFPPQTATRSAHARPHARPRARPRAARTAATVGACAGSRVFTIDRATLRSHTHTLHARCTHAARTLHARCTRASAHTRSRTHTGAHFFLPSAILTLATAAQLVCYSTRAARRCASPFNPHTHKTLMNPHKLALFSFLFTLLLIIGTVYAAVIMATI